ncbi:preprotein translocase subunit SecY [Solihabitans fulvus]|uniref:preprotein translocase subunit SecY n=1 Tax=Solihabitans fulvus TaxID=1892852 RepID=UPI001CB75E82|nr:preprotein translocase subunit SecY [Solihabitans fulvus]
MTLLVIVVFRLGQNLPVPGVNVRALAGIPVADNQLHWLLDLLTGGGLGRVSVFAFGVFPCLAAPVVLRALVGLSPRLTALRAAGPAGASALARHRRRLTVGLGLLGAVGVVVAGGSLPGAGRDVLDDHGVLAGTGTVLVACLTAGSALVLRLAEAITDRGVGDGVRVLLLTQVAAVLPAEFLRLCRVRGGATAVVLAVVVLAVMAATIFVAQAQRHVPVQYAARTIGRRFGGGARTFVPLRIAQSNGPAVLAAVLLYLPVLAARLWPGAAWSEWAPSWLRDEGTLWRMVVYAVLVCVFATIRASVAFDPERVADELARVGGFIPGIRPGRPTAAYLDYVHHRIVAVGAGYLGVLALVPTVGLALVGGGPRFPFGGVTMLVVLVFLVSVTLDTARRLETWRLRTG